MKFGMLTALKPHHKTEYGLWYWECRCDCGTICIVSGGSLRAGKATHCGCSRNYNSTKCDGRSRTRLYRIWWGMKSRCYCISDGNYKNYGALGITVCPEWLEDFEQFRFWAESTGYSDTLTLERKNVEGNYEPENCCWVPKARQARNRRNTLWITADGVTKSAADWADDLGVSLHVIHSRYRRTGTPYKQKPL